MTAPAPLPSGSGARVPLGAARDPLSRDLARLRAENEMLRETLAAFRRDVLGDELFAFPSRWGLALKMRRILAALLLRPVVSREGLIAAAWRYQGDPSDNTLRSHISHLRRRIEGDGLVIRCLKPGAYTLEEPARTLWRDRLIIGGRP